MSAKKDIRDLEKKVRNLGKEIEDPYTYREDRDRHGHTRIRFTYRDQRFSQTFASTPGEGRAIKNAYGDTRRKLRAIGVSHPSFSTKFMTAEDAVHALLEDLYSVLDKPYKRDITYRRHGKEITYHRHYVWQRRYSRNGRYREGFFPATEQQYVDAVNKNNR